MIQNAHTEHAAACADTCFRATSLPLLAPFPPVELHPVLAAALDGQDDPVMQLPCHRVTSHHLLLHTKGTRELIRHLLLPHPHFLIGAAHAVPVGGRVILLHFMICHSKSAIDPAPQDVIKTMRWRGACSKGEVSTFANSTLL
jgi:hypothetical protein